MPGSEITITIWTDHAANLSLASDLAEDAAKSIFRSSGLAAAVADFAVRPLEPSEVVAASELGASDKLAE